MLSSTQVGEVIKAAELEIRPSEYLALAGGRPLTLSVRELELLAALGRREGRIVPREELYQTVPEWRFIHTHFGFGYRFQPEPSQRFHKTATTR
jgi:DNA-binding response OmpR family regulator